VPVIVLSADDRQATRWELHQAGAYGYLTKPIDVAKLLTIVTTARVEVAA
jgi:DNA-binding response OmpR family regulator